jgi:hypothetical protein
MRGTAWRGMLIMPEKPAISSEPVDAAKALYNGARIVVGAPGVFADLKRHRREVVRPAAATRKGLLKRADRPGPDCRRDRSA